MRSLKPWFLYCCALLLALPALAQQHAPVPKAGSWIAKDFRFHTGEVLPELKLAYTTIGAPGGEPVLILHGTAGQGSNFLTPAFAGELFGPGQPLDAARYFIIIPDALGAGDSAKPSDGLRARFPRYNYDDMVAAQHRLVTEGLGLKRLRLVLGNSMGGMHAWLWATTYPDFADAVVPMACQPSAMSGRNWMMRRFLIDSIRNDPDYNAGNYSTPPKALKTAAVYFGIATNGGNLAYHALAPSREAADKLLNDRLAAPFRADANDTLYQWEASADYDPSPRLAQVKAAVLAINSADDERNPPELGVMERELAKVKNAQLLLIPSSADTRGHGTTANAKFWKRQLQEWLATVPRK